MKNIKTKELTEDQEQAAVVEWFKSRHTRCRIHHSPNGGKRNIREAAKFKRLGTSAGFPDLIIISDNSFQPFAIEMKKRTGGKVSPSQRDWIFFLESVGWSVAVCNGADEAIEQLEMWGF